RLESAQMSREAASAAARMAGWFSIDSSGKEVVHDFTRWRDDGQRRLPVACLRFLLEMWGMLAMVSGLPEIPGTDTTFYLVNGFEGLFPRPETIVGTLRKMPASSRSGSPADEHLHHPPHLQWKRL